jgi:hypothetical protein
VPEVVGVGGGRALAAASARGTPVVAAVDAVVGLAKALRDAHAVHQREKTARAQIAASRDIALAAVDAWHSAVRAQQTQLAAERAAVQAVLMDSVRAASAAGDVETLRILTDTLVKVMAISPLAEVPPLPVVGGGPDRA